MKKNLITLMWVGVITTCFLIGANTGLAFEQQGVAKGNLEVAAYMSWISYEYDDADDVDVTLFGGSVGYFISDPLLVGSALTVIDMDEATPFTISFFAKYHFFPTPTVTPYVGGGITYIDPDVSDVDSELGLNLNGGANFFITENTAFSPELRYDIYSDYNVKSLLAQLKIFF